MTRVRKLINCRVCPRVNLKCCCAGCVHISVLYFIFLHTFHDLQYISMTSVYSFGQGSFGQLGHGEEDDQTKPKIIAELRNTRVIKLACGARHSAAITDNGVLFTWGSNEDGGMEKLEYSIILPTLLRLSSNLPLYPLHSFSDS
jgi:hypothetical protein